MNSTVINRIDFFVKWWLYLLLAVGIGFAIFALIWFSIALIKYYVFKI